MKERTMDGEKLVSASLQHETRPVALQTIDLKPGQTHKLSFTVVSGSDQPEQVNLRVTPGVPGSGTTEVSPSACSG